MTCFAREALPYGGSSRIYMQKGPLDPHIISGPNLASIVSEDMIAWSGTRHLSWPCFLFMT